MIMENRNYKINRKSTNQKPEFRNPNCCATTWSLRSAGETPADNHASLRIFFNIQCPPCCFLH
uniref:Uncharacterized protein n=1 Tax=Rhizophora mucronata TaxID=61149 RepID=A0A2P2KGX1_RHIMU